jgi:hypothetical protein
MRRLIKALFIACPLFIACGGERSEPGAGGDDTSALERRSSSASLRRAVRELDSEWGDENIMSGSARISASTLQRTRRGREAQLKAFTKAAFEREAAADEFEAIATPTQSVEPATAARRTEVARIVATEGFVYADSRENIDPLKERLQRVIDLLGPSGEIDLARLDAKGKVALDDGEGDWKAHVFTFFNRETGAAVTIFVREGST